MLLAYPEIFLLAAGCRDPRDRPFSEGHDALGHLCAVARRLLGCAVAHDDRHRHDRRHSPTTFNRHVRIGHDGSVLKMFTYVAVALCLVYSRVYMADRGCIAGSIRAGAVRDLG